MKTCDMALRLKAHTADAAMLFLNVRNRGKKEKRDPTQGDERKEGMMDEIGRHRGKYWMKEG